MKKFVFGAMLTFALANVMSASGITYTATTLGSFDGAPLSCNQSVGGLAFACDNFNVTSDNTGHIAVGGTAGSSLGSFTLSVPPNFTYSGHTFTLEILFSAPSDATPNPDTFAASLFGDVQNSSTGVSVVWTSGLHTYADSLGGFTFAPNNVSVNAGNGGQFVSGQGDDISNAPEPATMSLMGGAFLGAGLLLRRKK